MLSSALKLGNPRRRNARLLQTTAKGRVAHTITNSRFAKAAFFFLIILLYLACVAVAVKPMSITAIYFATFDYPLRPWSSQFFFFLKRSNNNNNLAVISH